MELLLVVLNKDELFETVVNILVEAGVSSATFLESEGMGQYLAFEVPIFAGIRQFVGESKKSNRTILAVLEKKEIFEEIKDLLKKEKIDFTQPGIGLLLRMPVSECIKSDEV